MRVLLILAYALTAAVLFPKIRTLRPEWGMKAEFGCAVPALGLYILLAFFVEAYS